LLVFVLEFNGYCTAGPLLELAPPYPANP